MCARLIRTCTRGRRAGARRKYRNLKSGRLYVYAPILKTACNFERTPPFDGHTPVARAHTYCRTYILFQVYGTRRSRSVAVVTFPLPIGHHNPASSDGTPNPVVGSSERHRSFTTRAHRVATTTTVCAPRPFVAQTSARRQIMWKRGDGLRLVVVRHHCRRRRRTPPPGKRPERRRRIRREGESRPVGTRESHYCIGVRLVFLIVRRLFPVDSGLTIIVWLPVQKKNPYV